MCESHLIFLMCFKIANTGQAFYIAWHTCKKCLNLRSEFWLASSFGPLTQSTCLWSLQILFLPRNKAGRNRIGFLSCCPRTSKKGLSCVIPGEQNLPASPLSTFLKLSMPNQDPEQWPKHSDSPYLSLLPPMQVCPTSQQKQLAWGIALLVSSLEEDRLNTQWLPVTSPKKECTFGPHLLKQNELKWTAGTVQCTPGWDITRCSKKAKNLKRNLVHKGHVWLLQEDAISA